MRGRATPQNLYIFIFASPSPRGKDLHSSSAPKYPVSNIDKQDTMVKDQDIVGESLARVLPRYEKSWFQISHLRQLNLILLIPLLSSAVAGYDGNLPHVDIVFTGHANDPRQVR